MAERSKIQFRMRDLLWAVSLIGASLAFGILCHREFEYLRFFRANWLYAHLPIGRMLMMNLFAICAGSCFGAGVGCLVRKPKVGALWGLYFATTIFCIGSILAMKYS